MTRTLAPLLFSLPLVALFLAVPVTPVDAKSKPCPATLQDSLNEMGMSGRKARTDHSHSWETVARRGTGATYSRISVDRCQTTQSKKNPEIITTWTNTTNPRYQDFPQVAWAIGRFQVNCVKWKYRHGDDKGFAKNGLLAAQSKGWGDWIPVGSDTGSSQVAWDLCGGARWGSPQ